MNQKDLKKLAKKIADLETKLQSDDISMEDREIIEREIEKSCMKVTSLYEMDQLDELIQKYLKNF